MTRQVPAAEADQLRAELRAFLNSRPDLSPITITHCTTLSDAAGRNFLSGHLPGGRQVVTEFRRVLDLARAGEILAPGVHLDALVITDAPAIRPIRRGQFYQTETVRRVAEVLDYCADNAAIGVIIADFGFGKTEALRHWRERTTTASLIFEFDEFTSANKVDFVHQLAAMLDIPAAPGSQAGGKVFRALADALRERPCLLIFDQCETVRTRVLQVIRQLHDRTHDAGVGVVLLSAPTLLARMTISRAVDLGALTSRVGVWAPLSGLSRSEMAAIVRREGITDIDDAAFDFWARAVNGSMRRLMRSLDLLRAKHAGKRIGTNAIAGVAAHLWALAIPEEA